MPLILSRPDIRVDQGGPDRTAFAIGGVPTTELCATDRRLVEQAIGDGKIGVANLCVACTAKVDASVEALHPTPVDPHPGPWRWTLTDNLRSAVLEDATGNALIIVDKDSRLGRSARVRALTEAAPEMEALLREQPALIDPEYSDWCRRKRALLDRLDRAT